MGEPSGPKVGFIDTSQYRGHIDAQAVANSGMVGLFPRTTFQNQIDPLWSETATRALDAGLVVSARHRLYRNPSVAEQFDLFARTAEAVSSGCQDFIIALNCEDDPTWQQAQDFAQRCVDRWGEWPVAYYACPWLSRVGNPTIPAQQVFWFSRYASTPDPLCGGRTTLKGQMWQYTQSGECPGVNPPVDLNWFYGTREELEALRVDP